MVIINYNSIDPFSGISQTPFVTRDENPLRSNEQKGILNTLVLEGTITGNCSGGFDGMYSSAQTLISRFSKNFQTFEIIEDGSTLFSEEVIVRSITFQDSNFARIVPFTITLDYYKQRSGGSFIDLNVIDKKDEVTFRENPDKTVQIVHTVAAKGLNTDISATGAFAAAQNFVNQYTGWNNQVLPNFIGSPNEVISTTVEETANRLEGYYSVIENYVYDPQRVAGAGNDFIMRYNCEYSRDDEVSTVKVAGNIYGGPSGSLDDIKTKFQNTNFYSIAANCYSQFDTGVLIDRKIGGSINENTFNKKVDFNFLYTDNAEDADAVQTLEKLTVKEDFINQKTCASLNTRFAANSRDCYSTAWSAVQSTYDSYDPYGYVGGKMIEYGYTGVVEPEPISQSYSEDPDNKIIEVSYEYCSVNDCLDDCFESLDYTLNFKPAIPQYVQHPVLNGQGEYIVQDLGFDRRATYSLQGTVTISDCCSMEQGRSALKSWMNEKQSEYFLGSRKIIEAENIDIGNHNSVISFSASWSAEAARTLTAISY